MKSASIRSHYLIHAQFVLLALLVLAVGALLYSTTTSSIREAKEEVIHAERLAFTLDEINWHLKSAEASQREYVLSGDSYHLDSRNQTLAGLRSFISFLRSSDRIQLASGQLDRLEDRVTERIQLLDDNLGKYREGDYESGIAFLDVVEGQQAAAPQFDLADQFAGLGEGKRFQAWVMILAGAVLFFLLIMVAAYIFLLSRNRALRRAESTLKTVTNNLPGTVYQFWQKPDGSHGFNFVSEGARDMLGLEPERLRGDFSMLLERIAVEDQQPLMDAIAESARNLQRFDFTFNLRHPDGRVRAIEARSSPDRESDGTVVWNGYWIDVTEQEETRQQLVVTEQQLQMAVDISGLGLWCWDFDTDEVKWSERCCQLFDMPADRRITYDDFLDCVHPDDREQVEATLERSVESYADWNQEFRVVWKDKSVHWLSGSGQVFYSDEGYLKRMEGVNMDISERKAIELAMREAKEAAEAGNRAKSTFLATMSHEIRTPLNGVLGMLEVLSQTSLDSEQRTTLEVVRQSGKSLQRLIDDILDLAKIDAEKVELDPQPASVPSIITDVQALYGGMAASHGLDFTCTVDPEISPALMIDSARVKQILNNLISNALKFTQKGGIEIAVEKISGDHATEWLQFRVSDTGVGIREEFQDRLFEPFMQAGSSISSQYGGTGLGLTICKRLTELMGGTIRLASQPGEGTTFTINLPFEIADPADLPDTSPQHHQDTIEVITCRRRAPPTIARAEAEGSLVLVVDDHPTNRMVLLRQLSMLGYAAECAEDGIEGLELWQSGRFSLVLCDCNMPRMDGYELTRTIRERESTDANNNGNKDHIPVIACTANALRGDAESCLEAGMDDYLPKPTELAQLLEKMDTWLPLPENAEALPPAEALPTTQTGDGQDTDVEQMPDQASPLDPAALATITGGDQKMRREFLQDFRQTSDTDAATLEQAVAAGDIALVTRTAHRLKGASRVVGAEPLARASEQLERAGRSEDWTYIESGMAIFRQQRARLNEHIDQI